MSSRSNNHDSRAEQPTDPQPDSCLSFTVSGPWGHFRRVEGNVVKQTYKIMPRTTVAGMIAGMLGLERDSYYELFSDEHSKIAIEPIGYFRSINLPQNTLTTKSLETYLSVKSDGLKLKIRGPIHSEKRQRHNYEVLVDPAYRIDIWFADEDTQEELHEYLREGKSYYTPSLGLSEHLAQVEFHGSFEVTKNDSEQQLQVDSVVPREVDSVIPTVDSNIAFEKSPGFMEADGQYRRTTEYINYAFDLNGKPITVKGAETYDVGGRTVMFS